MKTEHNALLSQRRADAERELVSVVITGQPTRAEMAELATICPKGSVKGRNYDQLWDACIDIHAAGKDVDVVSVHDALQTSWKGDITLTDAIASLGPKATWPGLMEHWAGRLQEIGRLEQMQFTLEQFAGRDSALEDGIKVRPRGWQRTRSDAALNIVNNGVHEGAKRFRLPLSACEFR